MSTKQANLSSNRSLTTPLLFLKDLRGYRLENGGAILTKLVNKLFRQYLITPPIFRKGWHVLGLMLDLSTKCGYIDRYGNMVIDPQFRWADHFSEGLASVEIKGKRGYINKRGGVMIKPQFDDAANFSEGLALVEVDGKFGYINATGQFIIAPQFDWAENFSDGLALVVVDGRQGYIDQTGNYI